MANQVFRPPIIPSFTFLELSDFAANEIVVVPVRRSTSKNGDSTIAIAATTGMKISYCIEHPSVVTDACTNRATGASYPFITSTGGKANQGRITVPVTAVPDGFALVWQADYTILANTIYELKDHMTALRITATASPGNRIVIFGDY